MKGGVGLREVLLVALALLACALAVTLAVRRKPATIALATCSDYPNQVAAQKARDTRDGDDDGIYCESLPCPCAGNVESGGGAGSTKRGRSTPRQCTRTKGVYEVWFSATRYPQIHRHYLRAVDAGWPQILAVNHPHADARRDRLLSHSPIRNGYDRDEYPPAMGRGNYRKALLRGTNPRGWLAHVGYVPSSENQSHGALMGAKLRRFCNGQKFRYRFY